MALTARQEQVLADLLASKDKLQGVSAGQVEALLRFGDPSPAQRDLLTRLRDGDTTQGAGGDDAALAYVDEVFDAVSAFTTSTRVPADAAATVLVEQGVRPTHVRTLLRAMAYDDLNDSDVVRRELEHLRKEQPDAFQDASTSTSRGPAGSGVAAGRSAAISRGWIRSPDSTSTS